MEQDSRCFALAVDAVPGLRRVEPDSLQAIALPGGAQQQWGTFDGGFAQLINAAGLLPPELWAELDVTPHAQAEAAA